MSTRANIFPELSKPKGHVWGKVLSFLSASCGKTWFTLKYLISSSGYILKLKSGSNNWNLLSDTYLPLSWNYNTAMFWQFQVLIRSVVYRWGVWRNWHLLYNMEKNIRWYAEYTSSQHSGNSDDISRKPSTWFFFLVQFPLRLPFWYLHFYCFLLNFIPKENTFRMHF